MRFSAYAVSLRAGHVVFCEHMNKSLVLIVFPFTLYKMLV